MRTLSLSLVCALLLYPLLSFGGTTGKIKGRVTDKANGEVLIGATVLVVGTSLGATSNVEGEFVILNVPAGTYDLKANFIGYQPYKLEKVQVSSDLTTETNFALTVLAEGVAMQEIVVQRERDIVNKNQTNVIRIQTGEDLKNLPIRGVAAAVALNPGVVQQDGKLHIRGGREDEVGYYVEGANTRNVLTGSNLTTVIPEAVEEFQVQAGGYQAQYGGANSGIVRQTLKSGSQDFKFSLQAETDNFTSQNKQVLGTYSYGYTDYVVTFSGPVFSDNVKFFLAGENRYQRDTRVQFWEGFRFENLPDENSIQAGSAVPRDTVRLLEVKSGNMPNLGANRYTGNGSLTFDFNPIQVRLWGNISRQRDQGGRSGTALSDRLGAETTFDVQNIFDLARLPITERSDMLLGTKLTYFFSPTVLLEANVGYGDNRRKTSDPDHGDQYLLYNDSLANAKYGYQFRNYAVGPTDYLLAGFPFNKYGETRTTFVKAQQTRITGSADLTAQLGTIHEVKIGGSFEAYQVRNFSVGSLNLLTWYRSNPDDARISNTSRDYFVRRNGAIVNYGYDVYGNKIDKLFNADDPATIDAARQPKFYSAYIQDKIEYQDLIVNAGLRFDMFDANDFKFIDDPTTPNVVEGPDNPSVDAGSFEYRATGIKKRDAFKAVSPRLGFSFPVSDRTVFHLQFGKFIQFPRLDALFTSRGNLAVAFTGGNFIPNPVGRDLDPERTTHYEVGFTQQFSDYASFDITGFYKDISGQIQVARQNTTPNSIAAGYNNLVNGDFATTKGVEVSVRLRRVNRIQGQINYTFSDAKGTGSNTTSGISSVENGTLYPTVISPLDFNQSHRGSINLDYRFGDDDGGPVLQNLGASLLFTFNSGHAFTLSSGSPGQQGPEDGALVESDARFSNPLEAVNASTTPWNFNIDLRLEKSVVLGPVNTNFYVYVQNLLNTKNVINVYRRSGNAEDDGYLSNPELSSGAISLYGPRYVELYRAINLGNGGHYKRITGNDLWASPRQIRFGLSLEL